MTRQRPSGRTTKKKSKKQPAVRKRPTTSGPARRIDLTDAALDTTRRPTPSRTAIAVLDEHTDTIDLLLADLPTDDVVAETEAEAKRDREPDTDTGTDTDTETETDAEPSCEANADYAPAPDAEADSETDADAREPRSRPTPLQLRRRRVTAAVVLTAVLLALGAASGWMVAESRPDRWAAYTEVLLQPDTGQVDRFLATEVVTVSSGTVVAQAAASLGMERREIDEHLDVSPIDASTVLAITYDDTDPDRALAVVEAVLEGYLAQIENDLLTPTRAVYVNRIEELRTARAAIEADLAIVERENAEAEAAEEPLPHPTEERRLGLESSQLLDQIAGLEQQLLSTDIESLGQTDAAIITPPRVLDDRVSPTPIAFAALGTLIGAIISATVLFLLGRSRTASATAPATETQQ